MRKNVCIVPSLISRVLFPQVVAIEESERTCLPAGAGKFPRRRRAQAHRTTSWAFFLADPDLHRDTFASRLGISEPRGLNPGQEAPERRLHRRSAPLAVLASGVSGFG